MQEPNENNNDIDARLLKQFQILRIAADNFIKAHQLGYYDMDFLLKNIDTLRLTDSMGIEWKAGYAVDEWYKLENGVWVASFPPFPRNLLTDSDEYMPKSESNGDLYWTFKINKPRSEDNK